jgi:hypothetical protein
MLHAPRRFGRPLLLRTYMLRAHAHSISRAAHHRHDARAHAFYLECAKNARLAVATLVQTPAHKPERRH